MMFFQDDTFTNKSETSNIELTDFIKKTKF
jgi:hypothetical protein